MATRLQDAKIKLTLDTSDALAALDRFRSQAGQATGVPFGAQQPGAQGQGQRPLDRLGSLRMGELTRAEQDQKEDDENGEKDRNKKSKFRPRMGDVLDPLGLVTSAIGALVPVVGPQIASGMRMGAQAAEVGPAIAAGVIRAAAKGRGEAVEGMAESAQEALAAVSGQMAKVLAFNDAVKPTFEAVRDLTKLQVLAGHTPTGEDIGKFASGMFAITYRQQALARKARLLGIEAMSEGFVEFIGKSVSRYAGQ